MWVKVKEESKKKFEEGGIRNFPIELNNVDKDSLQL